MRLVDIKDGIVAPRDLAEASKIGAVAVHREHAFGEDQPRGRIAPLVREQLVEMIAIVVAEAVLARACCGDTGVHAGVDQPIGKDRRARHRLQQRGNDRGVGLPSGREDECGLGALECGDPRLELRHCLAGPRDQSRCPRAGAEPPRPFAGALGEQRVEAEAKIVVAREVEQFTPVAKDTAAGAGLCRARDAQLTGIADRAERLRKERVEGGV